MADFDLGEGLRRVFLAGVGALATGVELGQQSFEKSQQIVDGLVKKGELTVEQGKVLNQELRHDFREKMKSNINVSVKPSSPDELKDLLDRMTPEQLDALKEQLKNMDAGAGNADAAEEENPADGCDGETVEE